MPPPYASLCRGEACLPRVKSSQRGLPGILRQLFRAELSAMVALSSLAGVLFAGAGEGIALPVTLGIFLLSAGCSALNQWQEQDLDARMERTRQRPLPTGVMTPATALGLAAGAIGAGLLLLCLLPTWPPLLLGLLAVFWYNGIYTALKRRTPFAALPGAICGALPPMIGWSAAGSMLLEPPIMILAGTLFLWQIPHSWLLLCCYRNDLQHSGLPNLFDAIPTEQLLRINQVWLSGLALCYLQFALFGLISGQTLAFFLTAEALVCVAVAVECKKEAARIAPKYLFHLINLSMALLLFSIVLDSVTG